MRDISWLADQLSVPHEGLCCIEFFISYNMSLLCAAECFRNRYWNAVAEHLKRVQVFPQQQRNSFKQYKFSLQIPVTTLQSLPWQFILHLNHNLSCAKWPVNVQLAMSASADTFLCSVCYSVFLPYWWLQFVRPKKKWVVVANYYKNSEAFECQYKCFWHHVKGCCR